LIGRDQPGAARPATGQDLVVDSSALVAILRSEPEMERLIEALSASRLRAMSSFNALESAVVVRRVWGEAGESRLDQFIQKARIEGVPFDAALLEIAKRAWGRYGKTRHRAELNLGDCCAYATALALGRPLLCVRQDFAQTDLALVPY